MKKKRVVFILLILVRFLKLSPTQEKGQKKKNEGSMMILGE